MNEETLKAFLDFSKTHANDCKCAAHYRIDINPVTKKPTGELIEKDDDQVCPRERAWRRYVKLRDHKIN